MDRDHALKLALREASETHSIQVIYRFAKSNRWTVISYGHALTDAAELTVRYVLPKGEVTTSNC